MILKNWFMNLLFSVEETEKKKEEICCRKALANPPSFVSYNL